ncbi:MAG: hypothetical protein CME25_24180 [Gemmatimonadetes bacterium]|nr:hypothetical protein [Gemmatimonadota bacterium]
MNFEMIEEITLENTESDESSEDENLIIEIEEPRECRICFEPETVDDKLIYPCLCNGTSKYIHELCLDKWRKMNYNKPAFFKCMECNYEYSIVFSKLREVFIISELRLNYISRLHNILALNLMIYLTSLFVRTIDRVAGLHIIYLIDKTPNPKFIEMLKGPSIHSTFFYYSYINFMIYFLLFISFAFNVTLRVKNQIIYWKKMTGRYLLNIVLGLQFILIYYFYKMIDKTEGETFVNMELVLSSYNLWIHIYLLKVHNKAIMEINQENSGKILNYED